MQLQDLLPSEPAPAIPIDATVAEAARQMLENDVGLLPVVDNERLVGVLTDRDIVLRCVAEDRLGDRLPVRAVMSVEVVSAYDDQTADEAKQLMAENGFKRLPVTDRQQRLVGVVSLLTLEGKPEPRKKPVKVTLYKEKTDSYGRPHKVSLRTVYVSSKDSEEEAKSVAARIVKTDDPSPATVANGLDAEKPPGEHRK